MTKKWMCGQNGFRVESPKYLPKSRRRPHTACQVGLRVSEKYSSEFFPLKSSFLFFSFLPPFIMYTMDGYGRKKWETKQEKISPFLYIVVGEEGSENRAFRN